MLLGEFHHNIDDKGRIVIPTRFREELGTDFVVSKGIEKCLYIYPSEEWKKIVGKLNTLPFTKKDTRTFTRFFYGGATVGEFDKSGRINIASPLVSYADLQKECVIIGVNDHIEIWDMATFDNLMSINEEAIAEISENLFEVKNDTL